MTNAMETQAEAVQPVADNTQAFRYAYGRLNWKQQRNLQRAFNEHHDITPGAFRSKMAGTARVSDSELFWLETEVETYFKKPKPVEA